MKKLKLFLAAVAAMVGLSATAQQTPTDGGVYYLYNTVNGKFLTRGNSWGTQAVTNDFGSPWKVYLSDGKYTLRMYDIVEAEGNTNRALGTNGFSDNDNSAQHVAWTLTGDANAYKLSFDDGGTTKYLCSPNNYGDNVIYTDANFNTTWQFLDVNEYKDVLAAKKAAQEAAIATTAGIDLDGSALATVVEDADNWRHSDASSSVPFPSNSSWTVTGVGNRGGTTNQGSYGVERYQGGGTYSYTATGLAKGVYKVGVRAMFRSASNAVCSTIGDAGFVNSSAYFSANGNLVQIKDWYSSRTSATAPNSTAAFVEIANNGGYYTEVYTYVGDDGTLELKAVSESYWGASWFLFNGVTLTYYSNSVSDEDINALIATIPTRVSTAQAAAMDAAKNTLLGEKTIANYNALVAAIAAAQTSVNEYAIIDAGAVPTNNTAGWAKSTTNGDLACNTWSTEGNTDGSGMTTPFIQDWVASGTALAGGNAGGKLYYTFTDLTPGETYVVTARVRVFNESGSGVTGATYFVGSNSKPLDDTFSSPCVGDFASKGRFAVLSCAGTVDANGDLQFGIELADDSPINWMSIKDVTIAAGTGAVPQSIVLNESSLSLTTGSTANLTATITPTTADDKTVIWTSSDETVVSVAGGTIVALKAGTATITANAYAGSNVNATCTVTVADATAPAFYSTEIANGTDYYIMNAATGLFLGGGNSWGTQASLIEHGINFTASVGDGVYTLDSHTFNNANQHFLGVNGDNAFFVDNASYNLYITSLGDGKFSISTANGSGFVTAAAASTVVTHTATNANSAFAQWYFLSKADRDKMLAAATAENPADATYYVKQANISRNLSAGTQGQNAWTGLSTDGTQDNSNLAAQVYNATVDVYQTIENIPNGTYTVTVQAFTSGSNVKFYANDQKVDVRNNDSGVASCSGAAALFAKGLYSNTVTVTVTDRNLKIGFEGDCSGAKWLCWDDVTLYMTGYTANTGVTAEDVELQIGQTAEIVAATVPATASFNALTYASSDVNIATVDENGVVTGIAEGNTTITITANEMENFSKTINVVVTLITPTAFALSESEVELDEENTSATLTITPTPTGANDAAVWTSSDETVATVANGVVTAVSSGTAIITATSVVDNEVSAQATVTVNFPESEYASSTYVNDGATRTITTLGENLIKNGSFEYPNALYGWTAKNTYSEAAAASNFTITATGGVNDGAYITTNAGGGGAATSLSRAIPVEAGKKYYFAVYTSGKAPASNNYNYNALFKLKNDKSEDGLLKAFEWPQGAGQTTSEWSKTEYIFTADAEHPFIGVRMSWNENTSFDNFVLAEITSEETIGNVQYALDAIPTANIGTGAFQYSQDAIDDANALVQGTATVEDVTNAYNALTTVNAPAEGQLFNVVLTYGGWTYDNKAMTYIANGRTDGGNYNIQYKEVANQNLAQAFTFTKVEGNNYKMSQIDADGVARYISTGVPYSGNTSQIRTTTNADQALVVTVIPTATEGKWNLRNTEANQYIGSQDAGVYTVNSHIDFVLVETQKPSITINTTAAGWGTTMLPFAVSEKPEGVKVYTCAEAQGATLTLSEVTALEANKPYIIEGAWEATLTGDAQGTALTYTDGLLVGTYSKIAAPNGAYILQKQGEKVGFFKVDTSVAQPNVPANRAYVKADEANPVKAFFLGEDAADAINSVFDGLVNGDAYDLGGRKVSKLQKGGVYIVNGKKVIVK